MTYQLIVNDLRNYLSVT